MAVKTQKVTADTGSAEVQALRNSYNELLAAISVAANFGALQTAIATVTSKVVMVETKPDFQYKLSDPV